MTTTVTIYSTPTCAPCRTAVKQLEAAGIPVKKVDLTVEPEVLADLKARLDVPKVNTPTFEVNGDLLVGVHHLRSILDEHTPLAAAA